MEGMTEEQILEVKALYEFRKLKDEQVKKSMEQTHFKWR